MYEDERILTVQEFLTPSYCKEKYSRILLQGKWLRDLGFVVGKKVAVQVYKVKNNVELVVRLVD